jgi:hypothetical protein
LDHVKALGGNWVSLTPFGRVAHLEPAGISFTFDAPFASNRAALARTVEQAHARGLRVLLVPHLWVESGEWRGDIGFAQASEWQRWSQAYEAFVLEWAALARDTGIELLAVGVELRRWVTGPEAWRFVELIRRVRRVYPGLITYASNWDDVDDAAVLGELDVIGINAFYPLSQRSGARLRELASGGERARERARKLAELWQKPILFTEFGYTTRKDCGVRPWEWPEHLSGVESDERSQADAYAALMTPMLREPWFAGAFVWRYYSDLNDLTQEPNWGFSPRGKLAESVLAELFAQRWAGDGAALWPSLNVSEEDLLDFGLSKRSPEL